MPTTLHDNLADVRRRIEKAAKSSGREVDDIKLIAVSKTHPAEVLRGAIAEGITAFGENRIQEAEGKIEQVGREAAEWHLVGHLQSNKARRAVQLFDVIQSLDSVDLAKRLERVCIEEGRSELPVFIEVDLAGEETKSGVSEEELDEVVRITRCCIALRLEGLMAVPPYFDDPEKVRPFFRRLRELRDRLIVDGNFADGRGGLSMGMSHDFEVAIEEGATVIRVGTAIFGERSSDV
jgi:PLP dependent protein